MSTTYNHVLLNVVDDNGNEQVLYPQNNSSDVKVNSSNTNLPGSIENMKHVVDALGTFAFKSSIDSISDALGDKVTDALDVTEAGKIADARAIKVVNDVATAAIPKAWLGITTTGDKTGIATLGSDGKILSAQLPSYVDDVLEGYLNDEKTTFYSDAAKEIEVTSETGKIYVDLSDSKTYRWTGSLYAEISQSLAIGTVTGTAFDGAKGQSAYEHISRNDNPHSVTKEQVGLSNVLNYAPNDMPIDFTNVSEMAELTTGESLSTSFGKLGKLSVNAISHINSTSNPHNVTKEQVGLSNVTNNAQVKAVTTPVTEGGVVVFGANGATVTDSGLTIKTSVPSGAVFTDTTYDIATGSTQGTISVNNNDIAVNGLGSAAYTSSSAYASATQGALADSSIQPEDIGGAIATLASVNATESKVIVSNAEGKLESSTVSTTELGCLAGVTSNIQNQLDNFSQIEVSDTKPSKPCLWCKVLSTDV